MASLRAPFGDIVAFALTYLGAVGALMAVNALSFSWMELPWPFYWALWGVLFAPAMVTTILCRAGIGDEPRTRRLYIVSLLIILTGLETVFYANARLTPAALTVVAVCVVIMVMWKQYAP